MEITRERIEAAAALLDGVTLRTPVLPLTAAAWEGLLPEGAAVQMKLELFQQAGSFKARGALLAADALTPEQRAAGVTAVSAGNHALAVSWSANQAGISAKVVMPDTADQIRVDGCRALGAEVVLVENVEAAFAEVDRLVKEEGRTMMHPFESPYMALGAATCGLEFIRSRPDMETIVLPIGGGGLIAGMASAIKLENPDCHIIGVEPFGADSMHKSFEKGEAVPIDKVDTIADSLGAPMALPSSYAITRANVDELIRIEDDEMRTMMKRLYEGLKIVAEPACAATTAAICGALRERLSGQNIGVIACGSNISLNKFNRLTAG